MGKVYDSRDKYKREYHVEDRVTDGVREGTVTTEDDLITEGETRTYWKVTWDGDDFESPELYINYTKSAIIISKVS